MPDDVSDIQSFYDASAEKEGRRLEVHQLERDMTWHYLDKYLPRQGKILEIGAATGAYTVMLAKRGYPVTAVDFAPSLLEVCRKRAKAEGVGGKVTCITADGRDLSPVTASDYDAVLMMGPFYHLVLEADRRQALAEATCKLKKGGVIFSTFISRFGIWNDIIQNYPQQIEWPGWFEPMFVKGSQDIPEEFRGKAFRGYFAATEEITPFHEKMGFKTLALAGIETAGVRDELYNALQGKKRQLWLDFLFKISTEKSIIGASNHLLYVGIKE
jgi:S-adenosylmethionine-dependent methyltransferase